MKLEQEWIRINIFAIALLDDIIKNSTLNDK